MIAGLSPDTVPILILSVVIGGKLDVLNVPKKSGIPRVFCLIDPKKIIYKK
jgi:hypothetical protein